MRAIRLALLGLSVLLLLVPAGGSTEPAPKLADTTEPEVAADVDAVSTPLLSKPVTYSADRVTIARVLGDLSRMTGVGMIPGGSSVDWRVRDAKITIHVKGVKLAAVMNSIAHATRFQWKRMPGAGAPCYRLHLDKELLRKAIDQSLQEEQAALDARSKARESLVDSLCDLGEMSSGDLEKLKGSNPWGYAMASSGIAGPLGRLLRGSPSMRDAMAHGQGMTFGAGGLSSSAQQALLDAMGAMHGLGIRMGRGTTMGNSGKPLPLPGDLSSHLGGIGIQFDPGSDLDMNSPMNAANLGTLRINFPSGYTGLDGAQYTVSDSVSLDLLDPNSDIGKAVGKAMGSSGGMKDLSVPMPETKDFGEPIEEHEDDPALAAKVVMDPKKDKSARYSYEELLAAIAKSTQFSVVSDNFGSYMDTGLPSEIPLNALLSIMPRVYAHNWRKAADTIELRDRFWFRRFLLQIPDVWIESWRASFVANKTLFIDDLSQIASLTQQQFDANLKPDKVLGQSSLANAYAAYRDPLRIYAQLTASQRRSLFSKAGLDVRYLNEAQSRILAKEITQASPSFFSDHSAGNQTLVGTWSTADDGTLAYTIVVYDSQTGAAGPSWRIATPKYEEPKE